MNTSGNDTAKQGTFALTIAAIGVVFGDIGTSPLYALKESFHAHHGAVGEPEVFGVLSLILWSLILIVSVKYIALVMRADRKGEGGVLALIAQLNQNGGPQLGKRAKAIFIPLAVFAAARLYGDGMITPAISVLSPVEGLGYAAPNLRPFVIPVTIAVLLALIVCQRFGTGGIGRVFGPVAADERISVRPPGHGFHHVTAVFGFMDEPHIPDLVARLVDYGISIPTHDATCFLSREHLVKGSLRELWPWKWRIHWAQAKHSSSSADFFYLPPDRVVEIGIQIGC